MNIHAFYSSFYSYLCVYLLVHVCTPYIMHNLFEKTTLPTHFTPNLISKHMAKSAEHWHVPTSICLIVAPLPSTFMYPLSYLLAVCILLPTHLRILRTAIYLSSYILDSIPLCTCRHFRSHGWMDEYTRFL